MNSKDKLSQALEKAGLPEMAQLAREGYYHDFESPLPDPAMELDRDLAKAARSGNLAALALQKQHRNGEFDAGLAESEAWARSPEGQTTFNDLLGAPENRRMQTGAILEAAIVTLQRALPNTGCVIILQAADAETMTAATTIRRDELIGMLRTYADHLESMTEAPRHDA